MDEFLQQLKAFVNAGHHLSRVWEKIDRTQDKIAEKGYPRRLPSFDEFVGELQDWFEAVEKESKANKKT
jgi:hypothetical protein